MALGNSAVHQTLLNQMAQAQGFDLGSARATGTVSDADMANLLTRCRSCDDPAGCASAMSGGGLPETCANDSRWDALRKLTAM